MCGWGWGSVWCTGMLKCVVGDGEVCGVQGWGSVQWGMGKCVMYRDVEVCGWGWGSVCCTGMLKCVVGDGEVCDDVLCGVGTGKC